MKLFILLLAISVTVIACKKEVELIKTPVQEQISTTKKIN